ncbi:glycosyltransferase family 4 protein [Natrialba swarupiae]|uniref:Glycosyltransferase family 4 protein n=1 Tax=Natrialba swarupiae TaxID=2448032 RepID=A0A5D5ALN6_9EURY|nr:glycosyltransferase family 4 protein [Natrialba swarupiae]TYT61903.1 glycosyltransferase family 4 protein [Natrialba swarupiae]
MRVGLVVAEDIARTSGGYRYDRKLVSFLERRGDDVDVIALAEYPEPTVRDRLNRPFDVLVQDELCYRTLLEHNPTLEAPNAIVALVHLLESAGPAEWIPRRAEENPLDPDRVRALEARYLSTVDAAICTSEYTRDRTTDLVSLPTHVAPPGGRREGATLAPEAVESRATASGDSLCVTFVGNLVPRKNATALLGALERADRDWTLTVVGSHDADPTYARTVRERGEDRSIASRVTFTGDVDDRTLASILERSHVLAVPSRYEGFGMVYLEAMEFGVVPIATAVGGADEIVTDGENGVLVDPEDTNRLAAEIDRLSADRDRLTNLARGALETAANHPTWAETLADLRAFLECLEPGASRGGQPADSSGCESDESGSEIP